MVGDRINHQINVTPLADVMLVLLIIFMVVTPLLGRSPDVTVPEADHPEEHPDNDETLVLSMREDGKYYLNLEPIAPEELFSELTARMEARASKTLFLKASEVLDYGTILSTMELCRRTGAVEIALITRTRASQE